MRGSVHPANNTIETAFLVVAAPAAWVSVLQSWDDDIPLPCIESVQNTEMDGGSHQLHESESMARWDLVADDVGDVKVER